MNIRTLGDLLKITEAELMSYKNFGESSLLEIKKMLSQRNLRLGQGMEDAHRAARRQVEVAHRFASNDGQQGLCADRQ